MTFRLLAALPLLLACGCAARDDGYPSLAPRAVEKQGFEEPQAQPTPVAADPALDRQVAELTGRLDTIAKGFASAADEAERKASLARGKAAGSDPWLEAQTALAALDDWRAQASALGTDIEQIAITRAATLAPAYPALTALGDRAEAEAGRQSKTIARLQAMLAPA